MANLLTKHITAGGFLLDTYDNAFAAYSLRKIKSGATLAIRVERSSDTNQTDVLLYSDGSSIDMSSEVSAGGDLSTWIGGDTGYVMIWYDQSGNNNDVENASINGTAVIVVAGVLQTKGGKSACQFRTADHLESIGALTEMDDGNDFTYFSVSSLDLSNDLGNIFTTAIGINRIYHLNDNRTQKRNLLIRAEGTFYFCDMNDQDAGTNQKLLSGIIDGSAKEMSAWDDGDAGSSGISWSDTYVNDVLRLGNFTGTSNQLVGTIQELILFSEKKTSDRSAIETAINGYYTIY